MNKYIKYILSIVVAGALLYFSFKDINWIEFKDSLKDCDWIFIFAAFSCGIFAFYLRGIRWRILLQPIDESISKTTTFNAINIGNIANFIFPRIGEFVRCGVVSSNSKEDASGHKRASYDKVIGTVVMERSWDLLSMLFILFLVLVFMWEEVGGFFIDSIYTPFMDSMNPTRLVILVVLLLAFVGTLVSILIFRTKIGIFAKIYNIVKGVLEGLMSGLKMKNKGYFLLITAFIWTMYWLMSYFTILSLPTLDHLGVWDSLFLMIVGSLGWLVPVPGGLGAFHFIVATALSVVYGLPFEVGIIFATISHESQALSMIITGGGSYLYESMKA